MKPIFSNTFNISHNKTKTEIALNFSHVYSEHKFNVSNGTLTDVSAQVCDEIASILLTKEGTIALANLLSRIIGDWE